MKAKKRLSFVLAFIILLTFALPLSACSLGKGDSAKVKDGVIELNDTLLDFGDNTVPDASETSLSTVELSQEEEPDGLASTLFELDLDFTCDAPVTVSIPLGEDNQSEDTEAVPMLGIGNDLTLSDGGTNTLYAYIPAEVSDGKVTATFVPSEYLEELTVNGASGGATPSREHLSLGIFWCSTTFTDGGHFIVYFPAKMGTVFINYNDRAALLADLESVYNDYLGKGYTYAKRTDWPIVINVQSIDEMGYYSYGWDGAGGKIYLNRNLFEGGYQASAVKPLLAHEFFHFVQLNYVDSGSDNTWFDEATATYFEGQASGSTPSIVAEYNEKIFSGVFPEENTSANGYSRMPLIKYLANKLTESFILNAYTIAGGGSDWDSALLSSTGPASGWAADFYEALVKGDVGSYAPYTLYKNLIGGNLAEVGTALALSVPTEEERAAMVENDEIPTLGETTLSIGPYGAQLVALTIDEANLDRMSEGTDPVVTVGGGADVRVFTVHGSSVTALSGSGGSVSLTDFIKSTEGQSVFLVLVTGLHTSGKQDYTVKVELQPSPTLDELVGDYTDAVMTFTDVYISPELRAAAAEESSDSESAGDSEDDLGCDLNLDIIGVLDGLKGTSQPQILRITKTGENTGTMGFVDEEGAADDPLPFTYQNGFLIFDHTAEGQTVTGSLRAVYGKNKDVVLDGDLSVSASEGGIRIDIHLTGSKPLPTV